MHSIRNRFRNAYYRGMGSYPAVLNGSRFRVDPYHINFWKEAAAARWEPHTFPLLAHYLGKDSLYCDVGAWIGPTVIYAATRCRQVVCFEPDPVAYRFLQWNIALNNLTNISSFSVALSDRIGVQRMASFSGNLGESSTSLLSQQSSGTATTGVDVLTLDWSTFSAAFALGRIDLLKIDIEGGEFALVPRLSDYLRKYKPVVFLSTHAPYLDENKREPAMAAIADVMSIYRHCLDENRRPLGAAHLTSGEAATKFRSYIFTD